jgi:hypothetical protein
MKPRYAAPLATMLGLLILLLPLTLLAKTAPRPLSSYNWAANASPNLTNKPPPKAAVRRLMEQLEPDDGEANYQTRICSSRFVDLGHDGNLTLLISRYDGGRGGCGDAYIVDRTASGFQQHVWGTVYGVDDVNQVLQKIDGRFYIAVDDDFAIYGGANEFRTSLGGPDQCSAGWSKIYGWDGSDYSNQSEQPRFKKFYEHEVETLKKGVAGISPNCTKASVAKIQRDFLGAPPNTGLDEALELTKSSDAMWRLFAANVLADIGTSEAKPYVRKLMSDPNQQVANAAKRAYAFAHFEQKPPPQKDILQQIVDGQVQNDNPPVVGPWRLILPPPFNGAAVDLKADYGKWWDRFGFDSQEQCEYGAEVLRKDYQFEPYRDGKCVPASALEKSATHN